MRSNLTSRTFVPDYLRPLPVGLGLGPVDVVTALNTAASLVGLNPSDPERDKIRIGNINTAFSLAMSGNATPQPQLTNAGGAPMSGADYLQYIATNNGGHPDTPNGAAVYGSQIAYRYAQIKWREFQARHLAGTVGGALIGQSDIPSQVGFVVQSIATNPLVLAGLAAGAYFLIKRRKR